ncbi:uncharacterized protein MONBRDRAFT_22908 [Monosiga brevicollis MX1]|uniref:FAD dependent oxidoreductase domain-containing protein n=1 Tax=Monosiga brevicollis TaxID=81824 RepID=A9USF2_MONBE|nr:uncharacterized protein MONBRDRAFT_22908 [Monosiga brevicollis MX1]EDQ91769.1 predicted protein [Monosiga brevicollis MX1]|eukprot:XP_001743055.1 hypothetical protein [Monosiga brevicollis MX1]
MASYNALSTTDTETAPPDVTTSPEQLGDELNALPAPPILDRLERFLASTGSGLEVGSSLEAVLREVDAQLAALGAKEAELEARVQARLSALRERLMQWSLQQEMQAMLTSFSFFSVDAALVRSVQFWKWSLNFLARCFADMNERRAFVDGLVAKSLTTLDHIAQTHPDIDFHYRQCGSIVLFFDEAQMARELQHVVPERDQVLTRAETLLLEPSLEHVQFIGAIRHTKDRVGNCREYVAGLARHAAQLGVEFRLSTNATDLRVDNGRVAAVELMDADGVADSLPCDYAVLACGPDSLAPLRSSGWSWLPILPVRGYSITGAARPELDCTPREYVLLDQPLHVIAVRFGDRIRFASHAELTTALEPDEEKLDDLERIARTFFPRAFADGADIEAWMGRRPMTSDSMPILGVGHLPNLILHTGHGADGWRWSHACAELTTALLLGETPDLPLDQLSLERFPFL